MKDNKPATPPKAGRQNAVQAANSIEANCAYSEMMPIADLKHHPQNPNQHSEGQLRFIQKVLAHQGWRSPLIVSNLTGFVVCGNGRLMAARAMGLNEVPVDRQDFASEADEIAHLLADNKIASLAELDNDLLKEVLLELDTGALDMDLTGFDSSELEDLMTQVHVGDDAPDAEPKIDQAAELQTKWGTKLGQIWELGEHRIVCGDSTSAEVVGRLMGDEKISAIITDPPYGINANKQTLGTGKKQFHRGGDWDSHRPDISWLIKPERQIVIWGGNYFANNLPVSNDWLCWHKKNDNLSFSEFELAWTNLGKNCRILAHHWGGEEKEHPTQKPLSVVQWTMAMTAGNVFDPFLGSGTTLIACENLGRKCRAIEIAPEYVAVAIERWHEVTGKHPELLDG
jgi:DNA modification methylase